MTLIDLISISVVAMSFYALYAWLKRLRRWPLSRAVAIAVLSNVAFYVARYSALFDNEDINLMSSVRTVILITVIAVIPSSIKDNR